MTKKRRYFYLKDDLNQLSEQLGIHFLSIINQLITAARLDNKTGMTRYDKGPHISTCHHIRTAISERTHILQAVRITIDWMRLGSSFMAHWSSIISSRTNTGHHGEQSLMLVQPGLSQMALFAEQAA